MKSNARITKYTRLVKVFAMVAVCQLLMPQTAWAESEEWLYDVEEETGFSEGLDESPSFEAFSAPEETGDYGEEFLTEDK